MGSSDVQSCRLSGDGVEERTEYDSAAECMVVRQASSTLLEDTPELNVAAEPEYDSKAGSPSSADNNSMSECKCGSVCTSLLKAVEGGCTSLLKAVEGACTSLLKVVEGA